MANRIEGGSGLPRGTLFLEVPWEITYSPLQGFYDFRVTLPGEVLTSEDEDGNRRFLESTETWDSVDEALADLRHAFGVAE